MDPLEQKPGLRRTIKAQSVRGGALTITSQTGRFLFQTASTVVLARILSPDDFGLIAMVATITNFALMFSHLGLGTATIQREDLTDAQLTNLFWINVGFGIFIAMVIAAMAPIVAWFYDDSRLTAVTAALSGTFVLGGLTVQHAALLTRHMRFVALETARVTAMALGVVAGVTAGVIGAGYWSLVVMHVTVSVATAVGMWIAFPWIPRLPCRNTRIRHLLGFGSHVTGFSLVNYFSRNMDNILIGRFLGSVPLGFYSKAYALMMLPIRQLRAPLMNVGLPAMSRLQDQSKRYANYYYRLVALLSFFAGPLILFGGAFSHPVVDIVLGPGWAKTATVFAWLAPAAAIQAVAGTNGMVLLSYGLGKQYLQVGIMTAAVTVTSFAVGIRWGITGVAAAYTIANIITLPILLYMAFRKTPVRVMGFFRAAATPYLAGLIAVGASRGVGELLPEMASWTFVLTLFFVAAAIYVVLCLSVREGRRLIREVADGLSELIGRRATATTNH
jgi:PST family polysaccharide transporter